MNCLCCQVKNSSCLEQANLDTAVFFHTLVNRRTLDAVVCILASKSLNGGCYMWIFIAALALVLVFWIISTIIQRSDKQRREEVIKKRMQEKKEQEEAESRSPFREE
jgi:flagellar biosynthesis/type III secretory pathway M-ring protein FliF/YscJ